MKVIATKRGYFGKLREPGDEFDVPDKSTASWFEPVGGDTKPAKSHKAPKVLSDLSDFEPGDRV